MYPFIQGCTLHFTGMISSRAKVSSIGAGGLEDVPLPVVLRGRVDIVAGGITVDKLEGLSCLHPKNTRTVSATFLLEYGGFLRRVEGTTPEAVGNVDDCILQSTVRSRNDFFIHHRRGMNFQTCGIGGHVDARSSILRTGHSH